MIIAKIKKISISLFFANFIMIKLNMLSPRALKLYYRNNDELIDPIYYCLGSYYLVYLVIWGYQFYIIKKRTKKYIKLK